MVATRKKPTVMSRRLIVRVSLVTGLILYRSFISSAVGPRIMSTIIVKGTWTIVEILDRVQRVISPDYGEVRWTKASRGSPAAEEEVVQAAEVGTKMRYG